MKKLGKHTITVVKGENDSDQITRAVYEDDDKFYATYEGEKRELSVSEGHDFYLYESWSENLETDDDTMEKELVESPVPKKPVTRIDFDEMAARVRKNMK